MKRVRLTYEGAYHHVMNRGIKGEKIFVGIQNKTQFLHYLKANSKKFKIRILGYCIMKNHYHIILENSSGKMSEFFRQLDGQYGRYYRKASSEKGYVFQGRYKSILIQNDSYLRAAIAYTLLNPVRAGLVSDFREYSWSSAQCNFSKPKSQSHSIVDCQFVQELFGSEIEFLTFLSSMNSKDLVVHQTRYGDLLGEKDFLEIAVSRFNRRERYFGNGMKRIDDNYFEPVEKIIMEFEKKSGVKIEELKVETLNGKRLRGELLVRLKDLGGLKYSEISLISPFTNLKLSSLPKLYKDAQKRREKIRIEIGQKKESKVIK